MLGAQRSDAPAGPQAAAQEVRRDRAGPVGAHRRAEEQVPGVRGLRHRRNARAVEGERARARCVEKEAIDRLTQRRGACLGARDELGSPDAREKARRSLEPVDRVTLDLDQRDWAMYELAVGEADAVGAVFPTLVAK